jgi:hypothetical protein
METEQEGPPADESPRRPVGADAGARWLAIFQDRYGVGAHEKLLELFQQPCMTFADIAVRFGVTRERVRQWYVRLVPDGPSGHERQRRCGAHNRKRELLEDALFRSFYDHARPHFERGRIELIKSSERYRMRAVRIDQRTVAIRDASRSAGARRHSGTPVYTLGRSSRSADFVYYRLTADDYLFLPAAELPRGGTTFSDLPTSRYRVFKNTFDALYRGRQSDSSGEESPTPVP